MYSDQLSEMVEQLKGHTEEAMTIEMAPWVEYRVPMDELYTELTLEQMENKPTGPLPVKLDSYKELFVEKETGSKLDAHAESTSEPPRKRRKKEQRKKILAKGDPGMGKSTLGRKMAYDWAKGVFTAVSVVFFVSMKLIQPGETIENIIIEQVPHLEALNMDSKKLKVFMDTLGYKILIIFDGLDEHEWGSNDDIRKIIEGRKLIGCHIFLTSRPHCIETIEKFFPIHVSITGFSKHHASNFVSNCLDNSTKAQAVMNFSLRNFASQVSTQLCPMLLLFLSVLVKFDEIDLARKFVPVGEIYFRLVRCVYRKYYDRKRCRGRRFYQKFAEVMKRIGALAWRMWKSGKNWAQRSDVINDVGDDAFEVGLLIGHKDFRLSRDETADILVTFSHDTIQEFMGAYGFLLLLSTGEAIEDVLSCDTDGQKVMKSPFFLRFCLWFLDDGCEDVNLRFSQRESLLTALVSHCVKQVNLVQLDMNDVKRLFPVLNLHLTPATEQRSVVRFIRGVLSHCDRTREFFVPSVTYFPSDDLPGFLPMFPPHSPAPPSGEKVYCVVEGASNDHVLQHVLNSCEQNQIRPVLLLAGDTDDVDVSMVAHSSLQVLTVFGLEHSWTRATAEREFNQCDFLTNLSLYNIKIDAQVLDALELAVRSDKLPSLTSLSFAGCGITLKGKLSRLFKSCWPSLSSLSLRECFINADDIKTLTTCLTARKNKKLPKLASLALPLEDTEAKESLVPALRAIFRCSLPTIEKLELSDVQTDGYQIICTALNSRKLRNLADLSLSMSKRPHSIPDVVPLENSPRGDTASTELNVIDSKTLTHLALNGFTWSPLQLNAAAMSAQSSMVTQLDISHSSAITGTLSTLLCHNFPFLQTLLLNDCGLNSDDLKSLAEASKGKRLPALSHLDVSDNADLCGEWRHLFSLKQQWSHLLSLNIKQKAETTDNLHEVCNAVRRGALSSLREMVLSAHHGGSILSARPMVTWPGVRELNVHCPHRYGSPEHVDLFQQLHDAIVDKQSFPSLDTLSVTAKFVFKRIDLFPENVRSVLDQVAQTTVEFTHLQEVAQSCLSLITTSVFGDKNTGSAYMK